MERRKAGPPQRVGAIVGHQARSHIARMFPSQRRPRAQVHRNDHAPHPKRKCNNRKNNPGDLTALHSRLHL